MHRIRPVLNRLPLLPLHGGEFFPVGDEISAVVELGAVEPEHLVVGAAIKSAPSSSGLLFCSRCGCGRAG